MKTSGLFSSKRREAFKRLLEKDGINTKQTDIPHWDGDRSRAPLSFAQQRLWLIDQMQPGSFGYNMPSAFRMKGTLNVETLQCSLQAVVQRHETLRTSFQTVDGQPVQVIAAQTNFSLQCIDLQSQPETEREAAAMRLAIEEAQQPFELSKGALLRGKLLRVGPEDHILLLTTHHIVSDGWSISVLSREAITLYAAFSQNQPSPLPELTIQYADFAAWQHDWLQGERLEKLQTYWQKSLEAMPVLDLPTDHPRPEQTSYRGANLAASFSSSLTDRLKTFSHTHGISLFTTLLAGFMVVLQRYSNQSDIVIRTPVANRTRQQTESLIGYFVNILALRVDFSGNPGFVDVLRRVHDACQGAFAHQDLPFEQVLEDLHPVRRGRGPLFPVMFILQNITLEAPNVPGGTFSPLLVDSGLALFDLTVTVMDTQPALKINFNYNTDLFEAASIHTMLNDFTGMLESALGEPAQPLEALLAQIPDQHIPAQRSSLTNEMEALREKTALVLPRNEIERTLAEIWQDVLGMSPISIHDNFFELGGDSLSAMRMIGKARQAELRFSPQDFRQHQTIAELANVANIASTVDSEPDMPISGAVPLTPNQHWYFDQNYAKPHYFNAANLFEVNKLMRLNPQLVREAIRHLILHHDVLRLRFIQHGTEWTQFIAVPDDDVPFLAVDVSALPEQEQITTMETTCSEAQTTLNLSEGPLFRVILFDLGPDKENYLFLLLHHLATDAYSTNILLQDFMTAYQQLGQGQPVKLPAKTSSFKDWSERLVEYAQSPAIQQELELWQTQPGETLPGIPPVDVPDPSFLFKAAFQVSEMLDAAETRILLQNVLKTYNMQLIEVMLAAMAETIGQTKGDRSLYVDILRHGRDIPLENMNLSRTVGWFVIHYPLLLKLENTASFEETLPKVRDQYRRPLNGGVGYDLLRYMSGNHEIQKTLRPRPILAFSHESFEAASSNNNEGLIRSSNHFTGWGSSGKTRWPYLLELRTMVINHQLRWVWTTGETAYERSTIERLSQNFGDVLKRLCNNTSLS